MTATHRILLAVCLVVWTAPWAATAARAATIEIRLVQTPDGKGYFDPVGVHIVPGDTVRWIQVSGFHSVTAYHPGNDDHELRIPSSAEAWDSDILLGTYPQHGALYERVFTVPGVYDYFCKPHELAGMVGRIVVGAPGDGPGTKPFGYAPGKRWKPIAKAARDAFPSIDEILKRGTVRRP